VQDVDRLLRRDGTPDVLVRVTTGADDPLDLVARDQLVDPVDQFSPSVAHD
jgi:hypothetical protein